MSSAEFSAKSLIQLPYPRPMRSQHGDWVRSWRLRNKRPISWRVSAGELANRLSSAGHAIVLSPSGPYELVVTERFDDSPMSDSAFLFSAWRILGRIDRELGPLHTIEGIPRNQWAPFRLFETGYPVKNPLQLPTSELLDAVVRAHGRRNPGAVLADGDGQPLGPYSGISFGELRDVLLFNDERSFSEWQTFRKSNVRGMIRLLVDNDEVRLVGDDQLNPGLPSLLREVEELRGFSVSNPQAVA